MTIAPIHLANANQSKFTCEITGHSNLTFFEAWESEVRDVDDILYINVLIITQTNGLQQVDSTFPDPLREPVLRKVQFSIINRIDDLGWCSRQCRGSCAITNLIILLTVSFLFEVRCRYTNGVDNGHGN